MRMRLYMAWKALCHNRRQAFAVFLLSACAMVLLLTASFLGSGLRRGLIAAVEPFDLLVGSGGSYQMVINTVFLQDYPAGNVPYDLVEKLRADPRVAAAIPLAFGDNYRGYRMVGTERELFRQPGGGGAGTVWLNLAQGEIFAATGHQAVLGARVARELGLRLGDEIISSHGLIETGAGKHRDAYRVCGILQPCGGPYDRAIFVPLQAIWDAHHEESESGSDEKAPRPDAPAPSLSAEAATPAPTLPSVITAENKDGPDRETTAILVRPAGYAEAYQLFSDFQRAKQAEMVFPSQVVVRLLSLLGQAEWVFKTVGIVAGLLAAAVVGLVLYWSACGRRDEMRVLGLLGAEKWERLFLVLSEGLFAILPGIAVGFLLGRLFLTLLCDAINERTGLASAVGVSLLDAWLAGLLVAAGILGGLLGGGRAMRDK